MKTKVRLWATYGTTVLGISLALFMLGMLLCVGYHSFRLTHTAQDRITYKVDLSPDVSDSLALSAKAHISAIPYVKHVDYISKAKAAEIFSRDMDEDFVDFIGYNPLYPSLMVNLRSDLLPSASNPTLNQFCLEVSQLEGVTGVAYQENVVNELHEVFYNLTWFLIVFAALLLLITFVLINSLIRIAVYAQRDTLRTMRMVGATTGFILRPFLWRSIWYGALGGMIASLLTLLALWVFGNEFALGLLDADHWMWYALIAAALILIGIAITCLSTIFTVQRYIKSH
ncbi:MAG: permease-like cell division protein FtsX [Bacteroidales bacterium]|nr:permease-like cell division protein FtsX [Bacteroidales bacterium]